MAATDANMKHRLELLERTVYALQAQLRLLEYRIQYMEDENKALRGKNTSIVAQCGVSDSTAMTMAPASTVTTPQPVSGHQDYLFDLNALDSNNEVTKTPTTNVIAGLSKRFSSLSLLDEPSPMSAPALTPARQIRTPSVIVATAPPFTPSSTASVKEKPEKPRAVSPVPWDGTIEWKLISLFKDQIEEQQAVLNTHLTVGNGPLQDQWIFQYGLRYLPKPHDNDVYRTVRVEGLPKDTTLDKLLAQVCYGDVFSADLLNTFGLTGYHTARIVFLHQQSAKAFCKHAKSKGLFIQGVRVRCTLEKTATYPMGRRIREEIAKYGCTRYLVISNANDTAVDIINKLIDRTPLQYSVEAFDHRPDRQEVSIRFHSMKAAAVAYHEFIDKHRLEMCMIKYGKDPCNRVPDSTVARSVPSKI